MNQEKNENRLQEGVYRIIRFYLFITGLGYNDDQ